MNSNERVRELLGSGLRRRAVAAIFGIDLADVKAIQGHPTDAEDSGEMYELPPTFGSDSSSTETEWCRVSYGIANLVSSGAGPRQLDLSEAFIKTSDLGSFSLSETGSVVVPLPGLYFVSGYVQVATDLIEGSAIDVLVGFEAVDTDLPNPPAWVLGNGVATADAAVLGFSIPFSGVVAAPSSQDVGPLKLNLSKSDGWSTTELGVPTVLSIVKLPGSGAYSV